MRTPTIHLNGTGQDSLTDEAQDALSALSDARKAILGITVHGRDFYPQGEGAYAEASHERWALIARLDSITDEITQYAIAVIDGGHKRE